VAVRPIPSHKVYSDRIKSTVWSSAWELEENVARNSLEFSFENWDPDQVLDEDTGLLYYRGELIHPIHFGQMPAEAEQQQQQDEAAAEMEAEAAANKEETKGGGEASTSSSTSEEDEIWKQTCERLGILPAEYYHSLLPPPPLPSSTSRSSSSAVASSGRK